MDPETRAFRAGWRLTSREIEALENRILQAPDLKVLRLTAIGYYTANPPLKLGRMNEHIIWMIRASPDSTVLQGMSISKDQHPIQFTEARQLWLDVLRERSFDRKVVANAVSFCMNEDQSLAQDILQQAIARDPDNPTWHARLGHLYRLRGIPDNTVDWLRVAEGYSRAADLARNADELLEYSIESALALVHIDVRQAVSDVERGWKGLENAKSSEIVSFGLHFGNAVLGVSALTRGDIDGAVRHLYAAGDVPPCPELSVYGPDLELPSALAAAGRTADVVVYLRKCIRLAPAYCATYQLWERQLMAGESITMTHRPIPTR